LKENSVRPSSWWKRRNWWKIAFFILLVVFEFTREFAVLGADTALMPKIAVMASVFRHGQFSYVSGRWVRIDGGEAFYPTTVTIQCDEDKKECVQATISMINGYITSPDINIYRANFTANTISYQDDGPLCVRYTVKIDFELQKVFSTRERKDGPDKETCQGRERRVELTLGGGYQPTAKPFGDHWVPLVDATFSLFAR
jgi:hypothetical protein